MKEIFYLIIVCILFSCNQPQKTIKFDKEKVKKEVRQMLSDYYKDISHEGLTAEFRYLDKSDNFFWVPPGYQSALNYDSVKTILEQNIKLFQSVDFNWETLKVFPLSNEIASFSGTLNGEMIDTAGVKSKMKIIESGSSIKREEGWKLLNGQTSIIE